MFKDFINLIDNSSGSVIFQSTNDWIEEGIICFEDGWIPIFKGIPRFTWFKDFEYFSTKWRSNLAQFGDFNKKFLTEEDNQKIFSSHWGELHSFTEDSDHVWGLSMKERAQQFKKAFKLNDLSDLKESIILDAGSGTGIVMLSLVQTNATLIMYELTETGVQSCLNYCLQQWGKVPQNLHIVQGNVGILPFKNACIDYVYSDGVLHHTPNTQESVYKLLPLIKDHGKMWIWLYRLDESRQDRIVYRINLEIRRLFTNHLSHKEVLWFARFWVIPMRIYHRLRWIIGLGNPFYLSKTWRDHILTIYDHFAVKYDHHHTYEEIAGWFSQFPNFCVESSDIRGGGISVLATKTQIDFC